MSWLRYEMTPEDAATWTAMDASYARYKAGEPPADTADARLYPHWSRLDAESEQAERKAAIVKDLDPAEAAHLIDQLERGYQAAWRAAREPPGHQLRADLAAELDQLALDEHQATYAIGMRKVGESIPRFLRRAEAEQAHAERIAGEASDDSARADLHAPKWDCLDSGAYIEREAGS